ncbi:helix-turn-helix domain-containing protein [Streptococcus sanguinis]|uniref:helix-turn-helix domain-containing protein n=1 Tax=Streptococcus sanguinis TaxID=1305 RepID=UPI000F684F1C|nr:helix-turn-helix transcriptional regulator [Streptococcus sanguinis]RSI51538.1 Helix-turn-helix domain protein [Streptococcus sanguinis]
MFQTFDRIKELAKRRGLSINLLEEKLGYSKNTIYNLKNSKPSTERISEIADYFNVSTDYLLGRTDNPAIAGEKVPEYEIELDDLDGRIMLFDGKPLSDDDKRAIKGIIEGYLNSKK